MKKIIVVILTLSITQLIGCVSSRSDIAFMSDVELCSELGRLKRVERDLGLDQRYKDEIIVRANATANPMEYRNNCALMTEQARPKNVHTHHSGTCTTLSTGTVTCF